MKAWVSTTLVALAVLAGSADAKNIKYSARFKAKYPAVASSGTLAVVNFSGKDGENFSDVLASALQSAELDGRPVFTVKTNDGLIYRTTTADLSKMEIAAAVRAGQKLGTAIVFTGTVTDASVAGNNFTKEESICAESAGFLKCKRTETKRTQCTKVIAQYSVTPRAILVSNGSLIFSEAVTTQGEYTVCEGQLQNTGSLGEVLGGLFQKRDADAAPAIGSPAALLDKVRRDTATKIRQMVAPYNKDIEVALKDKSGPFSKPDGAQFDNATAFANAGRMDRACSLFETLYTTEANKNNISLLYNMGVCQEVLLPDEPAEALAYYAKADQLLSRPDKMVSDAYVRMKGMVGQSRSIR